MANAVVMVRPLGFVARGPIRFPWPYTMAQHDTQFDPLVLIVPVGAEVAFPNHDPFKHHVYSFSPPRTFELKLYGREETRTVTFDKPGVVTLGCNIHDGDDRLHPVWSTPRSAAKSAAGMAVTIAGLPPGPARVTIWHPLPEGARARNWSSRLPSRPPARSWPRPWRCGPRPCATAGTERGVPDLTIHAPI